MAYVDSWLGDDVAAVQDDDGNDAEGFNFITIDNGEENTTGQTPIMAFVSVERPPDRPLLLHWALVPTSYGADSYDVQYARTSERPVPEAAWFDGPQNLTGTGAVHAYAGEGTATIENLDSATYYSMPGAGHQLSWRRGMGRARGRVDQLCRACESEAGHRVSMGAWRWDRAENALLPASRPQGRGAPLPRSCSG